MHPNGRRRRDAAIAIVAGRKAGRAHGGHEGRHPCMCVVVFVAVCEESSAVLGGLAPWLSGVGSSVRLWYRRLSVLLMCRSVPSTWTGSALTFSRDC